MEDDVQQQEAEAGEIKETKETTEKADKKIARAPKKKKAYRQVAVGRAYIKATYNNTMISFTDQAGNVLAWATAGLNGFKGPKKATPYAASIIVRNAANKVQPFGLKDVSVFVRGVGLGRDAAIRALNANGFNVLSIKDITPIPHNGCRKRKPRRV
ncbi:30S ribosomal protein S11 [Candidatus Falkowbacteria bacterium]|nr:30S ribosomal protein S11 [Candidatus Falkowbacteria bacterium]